MHVAPDLGRSTNICIRIPRNFSPFGGSGDVAPNLGWAIPAAIFSPLQLFPPVASALSLPSTSLIPTFLTSLVQHAVQLSAVYIAVELKYFKSTTT